MPGFADGNDSLFNDVTLGYAMRGSFQCGFISPQLPSYRWRVVVIRLSELCSYSLCTDFTSKHAGSSRGQMLCSPLVALMAYRICMMCCNVNPNLPL